MRRFLTRSIASIIVATLSAVAIAQTVDVSGRVFDANTKAGIANLEVKLTPPRSANLPIRVAQTGANGEFAFRQAGRGRYLIEVSQGLHLLYRGEIDSATQSRIDIPLQRR